MSRIKAPKGITLSRACRTCLSERGHLREIIGTKIPSMLEFCASVQIKEEDELPTKICLTCFHQIAKYYTFRKKLERSEKILRNYLKQSKKRAKFSDILRKAVNEAEIETQNQVEEDELTDEDVPLSERKKKLEAQIKKADSDVEADLIFTEGPPPLIPLKVNDQLATKAVTKVLIEDAPPLVPIKPILIPMEIEKLAPVVLKLECTVCGEEFNSIIELKQHRQFHCQTSGLQCNICKKEFNERKKLIGHLKGHMVAKDYGCKICGKRYPNPSTFKVHMRTHTGERPFKCQICNKGFIRWAGVVGHMKTHNSMKPYKCETCGKCFKVSSNLERHKVLHSGSLPFCCNFCGKTFSQADNLQLHIRTYHTFEKPYLCNECGKGFVSSTRLNRHMWVHSGFKPHRCKQCPKAYSNSNDLRNHSHVHSGGPTDADKPHACHVCDLRFYHACRLAKHMKIHEKKFDLNILHDTNQKMFIDTEKICEVLDDTLVN